MTDERTLMRLRKVEEYLRELMAQDRPGVLPGRNAKTQGGARGDGTTDDRSALNTNDTDADGNEPAYLPQGTYVVGSDLTLSADWVFAAEAKLSIDKFSIRSASYQWTASGTGTSEYYLEASGGGSPGITVQTRVYENGSEMTPANPEQGDNFMTLLSAGEYKIGDQDSLGFDTIYVRLSDSTDPDSKATGYVEAGHVVVFDGALTAPATQIFSGDGAVILKDAQVGEVYPEWWGAVGDGDFEDASTGTDNTTALQTMLLALSDDTVNTGHEIKLTGVYRTGALLVPGQGRARYTFRGAGRRTGFILKGSENAYLMSVARSQTRFETLQMRGNKDNQSSGGVIKLIDTGNNYITFVDCVIRDGIDYALHATGTGQLHAVNTQFRNSGTGAYITGNAREVNFYTCTFESNTAGGAEIVGSNLYMIANFYGCYFEGNGPGDDSSSPAHADLSSLQHGQVERYVIGPNWKWTASGSGTNEYYLTLFNDNLPDLPTPVEVRENGSAMTEGTAGSLSAGEYDIADNDTLGSNTLYVRLSDGADPDSKANTFLEVESGTSEVHFDGCYFFGENDTDHIGIKFGSSPQQHGLSVTNCTFRDCGGGAYIINSADPTEVGYNTLHPNTYVGTTPIPAISTSTPVEAWGFALSPHAKKTIVSEEIDLTSANTIRLYGFEDHAWFRLARVQILWTVAPTASSTINLGVDGDLTRFAAYVTAGTESQNDVSDITSELTADYLKDNVDRTLILSDAGTGNGGTIRVQIDLYDWTVTP